MSAGAERVSEKGSGPKAGGRIQDVARRAGVAIGTVSNVLNSPEKVSGQTRLRVEAAIAELGFVRNIAARTLAAKRTDTVGLVVVDIGNSLFVDIARGAEAATSQARLKLLLPNSAAIWQRIIFSIKEPGPSCSIRRSLPDAAHCERKIKTAKP